ncbi:PREDICTED: uncharacterized protein CXorf65 homolog isoform X2 [Chinchilla lanigera]|uniref:uncharacterized protein CXorf65 homolog isoform X2 n=1 Tax=Chinchilla lanigera TaxID=34839 RepID=UPI00038EC355|nr:PREDICTED: uncharacterized protein CXorf65 homolog isoform X2 [Chinchilla lanigera]
MFVFIKHGGEGQHRAEGLGMGVGRLEGNVDHRDGVSIEGPIYPILYLFSDNQQFLLNINCSVLLLMHYTRAKVGLRKRDIIDLCDEAGILKMFFMLKTPGEYASKFLTARNTYYVCKVERGAPGTRIENSYRAIVPLLKNPEPEVLDALRTQCEILERNRVKTLKIIEAKRVTTIESTVNLPVRSKSGRSDDHGPPPAPRKGLHFKTRVDFHGRRGHR